MANAKKKQIHFIASDFAVLIYNAQKIWGIFCAFAFSYNLLIHAVGQHRRRPFAPTHPC